MAISTLQEVFNKDLQELLFSGMGFASHSKNHDGLIEGSVVHVPSQVEGITVVTNPTGVSTPIDRGDTFVDYNVNFHVSNPTRINLKDELQTNYSLRESSLKGHSNKLTELIGDTIIFDWAVNSTLFETSGADSSDSLLGSATGTRKELTKEDLRKVAKQMDKDKLPKGDRFVLLPSDMYYELFSDSEVINFDNNNRKSLPDGVITELFGLNILTRASVIYSDGGTMTITNPSTPSGDQGALAWQADQVGKAYGGSNVFITEKDPMNYGADFLSAGVFYGGAALRTDSKGIYRIVQTS